MPETKSVDKLHAEWILELRVIGEKIAENDLLGAQILLRRLRAVVVMTTDQHALKDAGIFDDYKEKVVQQKEEPDDENAPVYAGLVPTCDLPPHNCLMPIGASMITRVWYDHEETGCWFVNVVDKLEEIEVTEGWVKVHEPKRGGYLLEFPDGHISYASKEDYDKGYTKVLS